MTDPEDNTPFAEFMDDYYAESDEHLGLIRGNLIALETALQKGICWCWRLVASTRRSSSCVKRTRPNSVARSSNDESSILSAPSSKAITTSTLRKRRPTDIARGTLWSM
jgi:hypothetical protein